MAQKFTDEQEMAATHGAPQAGQAGSGHNVLVSASAGSGKTTVLVNRILRQVLAGGDISHLLVVTFTNAAAAEMKERIGKSLKEYLTAHRQEMAGDARRHLTGQIGLVDSAPISTLDAFALQIVQQYYYVVDLDPGFRVLADQTESLMIQESVWDNLREELYTSDGEAFANLTQNFSSSWHDEGLGDLIFRVYQYAETTTDPDGWIAKLPAAYTADLNADSPFAKQLQTALQPFTSEIIALLKQAANLVADEMAVAPDNGSLPSIQTTLRGIQDVQDLLGGDYAALQQAASSVSWPKWPAVSGKIYKDDPVLKEKHQQANELRKQAKDLLDKQVVAVLQLSADELQQTNQHAAALATELSKVAKQFKDAYWQEKQRRHVMDFADVEQLALAILLAPGKDGSASVGSFYKESFAEVLVDEYQDINPLQEALLDAVSRTNPGNRFMVGDVKQSIYGFRLAEPQLFMNKYDTYPDSTADPSAFKRQGEHISLAANFRSEQGIIDFTNLIFKQVMDQRLGAVNYTGGEELQFKAAYYPESEAGKATELLIYTPDAESDATNELDKDQGQVQLVAKRIQQLLAEPDPSIFDRKSGTMRKIKYQDITLLVPTRSQNLLIQEIFADAGIPVVVSDAQNYFKTTELQVMLAMLRVIDNPQQDIPLVAVLRSPMVGLTADELALLRLANKGARYYDALMSFMAAYDSATATALAARTHAKVQAFLDELADFRTLARENRLVDLIWAVYERTGYLDFVGGMPGGRQRQANLHALYERAHSYEEGGFKGLFAFVHFIELMQERDKDLANPVAIDAETDAVHLMTIHGSKGLEFPVVFLMNTSRSLHSSHQGDGTAVLSQQGIGLQWFDQQNRVNVPLPQYILAKGEQNRREQAESLRVLYVALTRAEQQLFIVGAAKSEETTVAKWQELASGSDLQFSIGKRLGAGSELDFIGASLVRHPLFPGNEGTGLPALINDPTKFRITFTNAVATSGSAKLAAAPQQPALDVDLDQWLSYQYPYTAASETTGFQSVSEIKDAFADPSIEELNAQPQSSQLAHRFSDDLASPQFISQAETKASGAAVGTATHLLLQTLDLTTTIDAAALDATISTLTARKLITPEVAAHINREHILRFFSSELGQKLLASPQAVRREVPFSMLLPAAKLFTQMQGDEESVLVHGIMDGYLDKPDELILFDYKTDHVGKGGSQTIMARYDGQLRLYAQALAQMAGRPVTASYLVLLDTGETVALAQPGAYDKK
ncbi:helicase-exonuclease AddAB subunit AddA [Lacticaseibacillus zhaodongensis]|uniref:helicase-exonuclease AddAB subunit AddA n=1 Tax=Lacticaseibacillus zhaodongensis TaxID=2668065 RepID=UPI0012D2E16B|nr:helicase-exonuclease AddAB subunit AddA [Lacticaseibacillus zhaodongensis]